VRLQEDASPLGGLLARCPSKQKILHQINKLDCPRIPTATLLAAPSGRVGFFRDRLLAKPPLIFGFLLLAAALFFVFLQVGAPRVSLLPPRSGLRPQANLPVAYCHRRIWIYPACC
jgi:hypothetical protein